MSKTVPGNELKRRELGWDATFALPKREPARWKQMSADMKTMLMRPVNYRGAGMRPSPYQLALPQPLPAFKSVATALGFDHHYGTDPRQELKVLKQVMVREHLVMSLRSCCDKLRATPNMLPDLLELLKAEILENLTQIRDTTVALLEIICKWRASSQPAEDGPPLPFMWQGQNYVLKIVSDLDFMGEHAQMADLLAIPAYKMLLNPLMLPNTLTEGDMWIQPPERAAYDMGGELEGELYDQRLRLRQMEWILLKEIEAHNQRADSVGKSPELSMFGDQSLAYSVGQPHKQEQQRKERQQQQIRLKEDSTDGLSLLDSVQDKGMLGAEELDLMTEVTAMSSSYVDDTFNRSFESLAFGESTSDRNRPRQRQGLSQSLDGGGRARYGVVRDAEKQDPVSRTRALKGLPGRALQNVVNPSSHARKLKPAAHDNIDLTRPTPEVLIRVVNRDFKTLFEEDARSKELDEHAYRVIERASVKSPSKYKHQHESLRVDNQSTNSITSTDINAILSLLDPPKELLLACAAVVILSGPGTQIPSDVSWDTFRAIASMADLPLIMNSLSEGDLPVYKVHAIRPFVNLMSSEQVSPESGHKTKQLNQEVQQSIAKIIKWVDRMCARDTTSAQARKSKKVNVNSTKNVAALKRPGKSGPSERTIPKEKREPTKLKTLQRSNDISKISKEKAPKIPSLRSEKSTKKSKGSDSDREKLPAKEGSGSPTQVPKLTVTPVPPSGKPPSRQAKRAPGDPSPSLALRPNGPPPGPDASENSKEDLYEDDEFDEQENALQGPENKTSTPVPAPILDIRNNAREDLWPDNSAVMFDARRPSAFENNAAVPTATTPIEKYSGMVFGVDSPDDAAISNQTKPEKLSNSTSPVKNNQDSMGFVKDDEYGDEEFEKSHVSSSSAQGRRSGGSSLEIEVPEMVPGEKGSTVSDAASINESLSRPLSEIGVKESSIEQRTYELGEYLHDDDYSAIESDDGHPSTPPGLSEVYSSHFSSNVIE